MVDHVSVVFAALGDPTRRGIFDDLLRRGESTASALSFGADVSRQAIVKHLQVLAAAGLVEPRREGREVIYRPTPEGSRPATQWLTASSDRWQKRLSSLNEKVVRHQSRG
jgi:DNA-binding transcriptional ArsR family regulator